MELVSNIVRGLLAAAATSIAQGVWNAGQWTVSYLRKAMRESRSDAVLRFMHELGCLNDNDVRKLVEQWASSPKISASQRDEMTILLINLVHGARFHTTCGTPVSSYMRCERLIEQLLSNIQPHRHKGEPVGPGRNEWILEKFLGMGSFGEVWLGRNKMHPRPQAFKFFTSEEGGEWISREQETLYHIQNRLAGDPNIIQFEDVVIEGQKWPFLVLEYVGGGSLEDWILAHPQDRARLDVFEIMSGIARGLAKAHAEKIYHRDMKPANILLTEGRDVQAKVADFGLGKVDQGMRTANSAQMSQALVVGTQMYLPPEANEPYEPRSPAKDDVFAFGVIWYQLLVCRQERPPYDFIDRLRQHGVDSATIQRIARCLAHPNRRYSDAGDLLEAMDDVIPATWNIPVGCFDVGALASEYLHSQSQ